MPLTAVNMEIASEQSGHQVVGMGPNMCITPAAPSPLPMPYPIMGDTGMLGAGTDKTKAGGKKMLNLKGKTKMCSGNEAGVQKDIVSMQTKGTTFPLVGVPVVLIEGAPIVVTGMPGMMNSI